MTKTQKVKVSDILQSARDSFEKAVAASSAKLTYEQESLFVMEALAKDASLKAAAEADPQRLKVLFVKIGAIGLSTNPINRFAVLCERDGRLHLEVTYHGLIQVHVEIGAIKHAKAATVHKADTFVYNGPLKAPEHRSDKAFSKDRGEIVGAYCEAVLPDGSVMTEIMPIDEIMRIRDMSTAYQQGHGVWVDFEIQAVKKTVIKRAAQSWPKVGHVRQAEVLTLLNEDNGEGIDFTKDKPAPVVDESVYDETKVSDERKAFVQKLVDRAVEINAFAAAESTLRDRFKGNDLAYGLAKLCEAEKGGTPKAA